MACDYAALRSFGMTGISPDLVTPTPAQLPRYLQQTRLARDAGFRPPFLDYTSVKRLDAAAGTAAMAADIAAAETKLAAAGLPAPLWAITDEPADDPAGIAALQRVHDALQAQAPGAKRAGQLNNPSNRKLLGLFDTVLVNFGYGVSAAGFAELQGRDITPWLYNMLDYRGAAGFLFWRVGAHGYLQWHARAFTADPRDPTDGRESEYAILPLSASRSPRRCATICSPPFRRIGRPMPKNPRNFLHCAKGSWTSPRPRLKNSARTAPWLQAGPAFPDGSSPRTPWPVISTCVS
jgi:hypothetical protein